MEAKENKMLTGTIWKQILIFFFPILIGTFFQQLYNTIDALIVGRYSGKIALSAVGGSSAQIINFVVGFFTGLTGGASVLIAQYYGGKDKKKLKDALHTAYGFSIAGGLVLSIICFFMTPSILRLMNTPQELMEASTIYIRVYFVGLLFVFIYNMGSSVLRAIGDSKRPLYFLIVCSIVNIILDLVLVIGFDMGVLGVAIATLVAQGVSACLVTWWLMRENDEVRLELKHIRIKPDALKAILRIGIPNGIQSSMYCISNMIVQSALNLFGVDTMAAWTAYGKVDVLFWMINASFGIAASTFVGQNFGAGLYHRMRRGARVCLLMALGCAVMFSLIFITAGQMLLGIFTEDANVIEIGMVMITTIAPTYFLFVFIEILSGVLRAQGKTLVCTTISILGICVYRIAWVNVLGTDVGLRELVLCYPISWLICAAAIIAYYLYQQKKLEVKHIQTVHANRTS